MKKVSRSGITSAASFLFLAATVLAGCSGSDPGESVKAGCGLDASHFDAFNLVPEGSFRFANHPVYPEEGPAQLVHVDGFEILSHEVTNAEFAKFVRATGFVTDAERSIDEGRYGAGSAVFGQLGSQKNMEWRLDATATWRTPSGKGSDLRGRDNYPVVHISYNDAKAYAEWVGARLPTEVELEYAIHLGLPDPMRATSGAFDDAGDPQANTWQGFFPLYDEGDDGFKGSAPAGCFGPDQLGNFDLIGNVWEWTSTPAGVGQYIIKGGSYLCSENFCRRYRPEARQRQDRDFSTNHIGFRVIRDSVKDE